MQHANIALYTADGPMHRSRTTLPFMDVAEIALASLLALLSLLSLA
jgi:hypothetical protein